jgi:methylated-DNA-[protein]-cysteine S-methyltransferase
MEGGLSRVGEETDTFYYTAFNSEFGKLRIVWQNTARPIIHRVFLPSETDAVLQRIWTQFGNAHRRSCPPIAELGATIQQFLEGNDVTFSLDTIAFAVCPIFQRRVLLAEWKIPRGYVSTYGRIAQRIGVPGSARAVGRALAQNPFPLLIPCHRVVRSNGTLGGYQGGVQMKRVLLEREGITFSEVGKIISAKMYY